MVLKKIVPITLSMKVSHQQPVSLRLTQLVLSRLNIPLTQLYLQILKVIPLTPLILFQLMNHSDSILSSWTKPQMEQHSYVLRAMTPMQYLSPIIRL